MDKISENDSFSLVGKFIREWSLIEFGIDRAISGALSLNDTQSLVISKMLGFRTKMRIIRNLLNSPIMNTSQKEKHKSTLKEVEDFYSVRNTIAHSYYRVSVDGSHIQFLEKSNEEGVANLYIEKLYHHDFSKRFERVDAICVNIEELRSELKSSSTSETLVNALTREME